MEAGAVGSVIALPRFDSSPRTNAELLAGHRLLNLLGRRPFGLHLLDDRVGRGFEVGQRVARPRRDDHDELADILVRALDARRRAAAACWS